jgi:acylphosphatase
MRNGHVVKWIFWYFINRVDKMVRIEVNYKGRVQGVGFRWQVCNISKNFNCTGYVKNLLDGSVEFLAEGELKEVESFIETVDSTLKGYWNHKSADKRAGLPHFQDFAIRY